MRSAVYRHAKILASQVILEVKSVQDNVLQAIATHMSQFEPDPDDAPPLAPPRPKLSRELCYFGYGTTRDAMRHKILVT